MGNDLDNSEQTSQAIKSKVMSYTHNELDKQQMTNKLDMS